MGLIFHTYHLIIRKAGVGRILLYLLDSFIWLIMVIPVFLALLLINHGEMRVYVLIALGAGGVVYRFCVAGLIEKPLSFIAQVLVNGVRRVVSFLLYPVVAMKKWLMSRLHPGAGEDGEDKED